MTDIANMFIEAVCMRLGMGEMWTSYIDIDGIDDETAETFMFLAKCKGVKAYRFKNIALVFYTDESQLEKIQKQVEDCEPTWLKYANRIK